MTFRYTYFELNFPFSASTSRPHGCTLQHIWSTANLFPKVSFFMLQGIVNVVRSTYDNKYSMNSQIIAIIIISLPH